MSVDMVVNFRSEEASTSRGTLLVVNSNGMLHVHVSIEDVGAITLSPSEARALAAALASEADEMRDGATATHLEVIAERIMDAIHRGQP